MYECFDTQLSRQHREDLRREAEKARLERKLRSSRKLQNSAWLWELHRHLGSIRKLLGHR